MWIKLVLLYLGLFQIELPWYNRIQFKELRELAIQLEISKEDDRWIDYHSFLRDFYDGICLPSVKEAFLYDKGDGWNPLQPTVWYTHHGKNVRGWIDYLQRTKRENLMFGNKEVAAEIDEFIKDLEYVHSIYDKVDDAARLSYRLIARRKAIKWVKDRIGEKAWFAMDLPRPEEYLFPNWKVAKK